LSFIHSSGKGSNYFGYVTFSVDLKPGIGNLGQIKNKATIIFDCEDPIETNEYRNTLDLVAPTCNMTSAVAKGGKVIVRRDGTDGESGVSRYKFFVTEKGGEPKLFAEEFRPEGEWAIPEGGNLKDYRFFSLPIDRVGNMQQEAPVAIEATEAGKGNGDANGDGTVDGKDVEEVRNAIMGWVTEAYNAANADVNGDGLVNVADLVMIIKMVAGN